MKILDILDKDLKKRSPICPICKKPKNGIIRNGSTKEKSGICVCGDE